jgi:hypothetical protein
MDKKSFGKIINIAIPVLAVLLIAESIYAVLSLTRGKTVSDRGMGQMALMPTTVSMRMSTEPRELRVGEEFVLWIKAELLEDYEISGSDLFVGYDMKGFEVVAETGGKGAALEKGMSLTKVLRNIVDKTNGQVVVSVVEEGQPSMKAGSLVDLVGIRFKAIESGNYQFILTKKGEETKAGSTFVEKSDEATEIEFSVEPLMVSVI